MIVRAEDERVDTVPNMGAGSLVSLVRNPAKLWRRILPQGKGGRLNGIPRECTMMIHHMVWGLHPSITKRGVVMISAPHHTNLNSNMYLYSYLNNHFENTCSNSYMDKYNIYQT